MSRSDNKNSGWSVGVFLGLSGNSVGLGIEGSAQKGKGYENSDSITQANSYLNAGTDTNVIGKVGKLKVESLNIESLQDKATYKDKQINA